MISNLDLPLSRVFIGGEFYNVISRTTADDCPKGDLRSYLLKMKRSMIYLKKKRGDIIYFAWEFQGPRYSTPIKHIYYHTR